MDFWDSSLFAPQVHRTDPCVSIVPALPQGSIEDVAHHAVKLNVFHTVNFLLKFSGPIREKVRSRQLEIQGAIYDLPSGRVDFLGCSPDQDES